VEQMQRDIDIYRLIDIKMDMKAFNSVQSSDSFLLQGARGRQSRNAYPDI